jgi:hypothetical protein
MKCLIIPFHYSIIVIATTLRSIPHCEQPLSSTGTTQYTHTDNLKKKASTRQEILAQSRGREGIADPAEGQTDGLDTLVGNLSALDCGI